MWDSVAWAQGISGGTGTGGGLLSLVPFVLIRAVRQLLHQVHQQKRKKQSDAMMAALKKGDKVVTASGIWGTITNMGKDTVTLQIADNTKIKIQKEHIARLRGDEED